MPQDSVRTELGQSLYNDSYVPQLGVFDEMRDSEGQIRPHWRHHLDVMRTLGADGIAERAQEAHRLARENRLSCGDWHDNLPAGLRAPEIDIFPLLLRSDEWAYVERGLAQRADLFNAIFQNLFTPGDSTLSRLLPPGFVDRHLLYRESTREVFAAKQKRSLIHYSADLSRFPDGRWRVLANRARNPAGVGYAVETRVIVSRVVPGLFRDSHVHRLSLYFRSVRSTMQRLSPLTDHSAQSVVLAPGSGGDSHFEQAYIATYLGYTLAEPADLTMRDGALFFMTVNGLVPVAAVLCWTDADWCELYPEEKFPNLLRGGRMATLAADKVFLANGPGSSVLEEPGLAAYLPRLAEELLGEGLLLLDNPAWWCGDPAHLDYVLENLDKLRITVLNSSSRRQVLLPETMDSRELTDLVKKIRNDACSFVAQAIIAQSTCPTWVKERVVPCPTTLRTYLFQEGEGYTVMPGGLCTVTTPDEGIRLRKDTWILASEPERREPLLVSPSDRGPDSSHDEHSREELPPKDQGTDRVQVAYSLRSTEDAAPGSTVMNLDPRGLRYSPDADVGGHLFVSYSHADRKWLERLKVHLKPLIRDGMKVWDDTLIRPGSDWRKEIATALDTARAAVVLVSADFLASDFIAETELPVLLQAAEERGTSIFPVIISHSRYADTKLSRFQSINDPKRPLARLDRTQRDEVFVKVGKAIEEVWQRKRFAQQALVLPPLPSTRLADPQPRFASDQVRVLSERLETAYGSLEDALAAGQDTQAIRLEILSLRRELRDGGQVRAGDFLGHGRYKLIEAIGRGGFGTIWRAIDRRRQQLVAIKVLHGQFTEDRAHRNRFLRGARQMGALRHPAIVSVLDENLDDDGYCWYAMEYLAGGDLHRAVLEGRVGSWENCLAIVLTVGDALAFAHEKGVVHRDIKPHNIVLDEAGRPKLTDFDLVLAADTTGGTRTGMLGTWIYAAPEIMTRPQDAGPQADVYSLAMTAIFALHRAELPLDIIRYTPEFISKLAVPPAIMQVLLKGSSWNCGERWASMRGFCAELERLLGLPGIAGVSRTDHG